MACQESQRGTRLGQRQFDADANGGIGLPIISPDNGVGIFQITSTNRCAEEGLFEKCADVIFNWRENVEEGVESYKDKVEIAKSYPGRLRAAQGYRDFIRDVVNPRRQAAGLRPIRFAPAPHFTTRGPIGSEPPNQLLEDGVRGYNGFAGSLILEGVLIEGAGGRAVALHEFRPNVNFLATVPDNEVPRLHTDPRVWEHVPPTDRPARGEPNYVRLVTSRSPQCVP